MRRLWSRSSRPAIDPEELRRDRVFVAKKLGLSEAEFDEIMALPRKTFWDYPSDERDLSGTWRSRLHQLLRLLEIQFGGLKARVRRLLNRLLGRGGR